ncbi:MAG: shikimate dehydrogenase [Pseudomonadota bacterium]
MTRYAGPHAVVIGDPIAHSRSPLIHRYWLKELALTGYYDPLHVVPDDLAGFVTKLRDGVYAGGNVTLPHKETIVCFLDRLDDAAQAIGAVNTLWVEQGTIWGGNTDALGFLANLDAAMPNWQTETQTALVLGAGGAARAVIYGLTTRGVPRIVIANRSLDRATALAESFNGQDSDLITVAMADLSPAAVDADLIINATSLGMIGKPPLDSDLSILSPNTIVNDLVYVPLETDLLTTARAAGCRTVDGLGMLLHQAVPGFERWFGTRPAVTGDLRRHIVAHLGDG